MSSISDTTIIALFLSSTGARSPEPNYHHHHHHHHHHQITKSSHSINAISPAPHQGSN
jgi:hypothetical protein